MEMIFGYILMVLRIVIPAVCVFLTVSLFRTLLRRRRLPVIASLAMIDTPAEYDIVSCENFIGRSKISDIRLNFGSVSRRAALLTYSDEDGFKLTALSNQEILVNDIPVDGWAYIDDGDIISVGGIKLKFFVSDIDELVEEASPKLEKRAIKQAVLLTIFQVLCLCELAVDLRSELYIAVPIAFVLLVAAEWTVFLISGFKDNIQIEMIGFFLTTFGIMVCSSASPKSVLKLIICAIIGIIGYFAANFVLKRPQLVTKLQYVAMICAGVLFLYNIIFGEYINGARNWISIGSFSFQPSELIKFVLIFAGGETLLQMISTKRLLLYIGFAFCCIGALFLMRDFGTASIYFVTMLIIIYMRQGNIVPILAILGVAAIGVVVIIGLMPYVLNRFSAYRHVWELASDRGYQQTRTLIAIASGGLFGMGAGNGNLSVVAASDTDLVFGFVCEEWGMITAFCAISCFVLLALYAFKRTSCTSSAYYAIVSCAAAGMFLFQISLNIFGSTDVLPLTGVTIPFVSNGGSSMIASWLMLSFIKAAGRQFVPAVARE